MRRIYSSRVAGQRLGSQRIMGCLDLRRSRKAFTVPLQFLCCCENPPIKGYYCEIFFSKNVAAHCCCILTPSSEWGCGRRPRNPSVNEVVARFEHVIIGVVKAVLFFTCPRTSYRFFCRDQTQPSRLVLCSNHRNLVWNCRKAGKLYKSRSNS